MLDQGVIAPAAQLRAVGKETLCGDMSRVREKINNTGSIICGVK